MPYLDSIYLGVCTNHHVSNINTSSGLLRVKSSLGMETNVKGYSLLLLQSVWITVLRFSRFSSGGKSLHQSLQRRDQGWGQSQPRAWNLLELGRSWQLLLPLPESRKIQRGRMGEVNCMLIRKGRLIVSANFLGPVLLLLYWWSWLWIATSHSPLLHATGHLKLWCNMLDVRRH